MSMLSFDPPVLQKKNSESEVLRAFHEWLAAEKECSEAEDLFMELMRDSDAQSVPVRFLKKQIVLLRSRVADAKIGLELTLSSLHESVDSLSE